RRLTELRRASSRRSRERLRLVAWTQRSARERADLRIRTPGTSSSMRIATAAGSERRKRNLVPAGARRGFFAVSGVRDRLTRNRFLVRPKRETTGGARSPIASSGAAGPPGAAPPSGGVVPPGGVAPGGVVPPGGVASGGG